MGVRETRRLPPPNSRERGRHPEVPSVPIVELPLSKRGWLGKSSGIKRDGVDYLEEGATIRVVVVAAVHTSRKPYPHCAPPQRVLRPFCVVYQVYVTCFWSSKGTLRNSAKKRRLVPRKGGWPTKFPSSCGTDV